MVAGTFWWYSMNILHFSQGFAVFKDWCGNRTESYQVGGSILKYCQILIVLSSYPVSTCQFNTMKWLLYVQHRKLRQPTPVSPIHYSSGCFTFCVVHRGALSLLKVTACPDCVVTDTFNFVCFGFVPFSFIKRYFLVENKIFRNHEYSFISTSI